MDSVRTEEKTPGLLTPHNTNPMPHSTSDAVAAVAESRGRRGATSTIAVPQTFSSTARTMVRRAPNQSMINPNASTNVNRDAMANVNTRLSLRACESQGAGGRGQPCANAPSATRSGRSAS